MNKNGEALVIKETPLWEFAHLLYIFLFIVGVEFSFKTL